MLITRETDYALRILRLLADGQRHTVKSMCESEAVPQPFAYKILRKLADAGLVKSVRGEGGGCQLLKPLDEVTLYDLLGAVDSEYRVSECLEDGYDCSWRELGGRNCGLHGRLWVIQDRVNTELKSHTLDKLLT